MMQGALSNFIFQSMVRPIISSGHLLKLKQTSDHQYRVLENSTNQNDRYFLIFLVHHQPYQQKVLSL